ncbi:glycoside hydrolase family 3 N-terminal domain-containing protein [Jiulongibacter sp. NS-SX5]|uniref:glycoside hydrolase family 3 N-terminal domain-containing protein n=1 Tax=Jiulongibacter sp. NS-SX5 TaxID=3463854 RepID=UPI0040583149
MKYFILFFCLSSFAVWSQKPVQVELGYRSAKVIKKRGLEFKDLNKNGKLDTYEDWRKPIDQRVENLLSQMSLEEKVGLMLISTTRMGGDNSGFGAGSSNLNSGFNEEDMVSETNFFTRKPLPVPMMSVSGTTKGVKEYKLRHFIHRSNPSPEILAEWANNLQELCEGEPLGIPAIIASNPRNHVTADASVGLSMGTTAFSVWPGELGLAAMRDLSLTRAFAESAAAEWRAVGLRKGYMYMADLATEPRWQRIEGTFGEDADLAADMMREIVLGFQGEGGVNTKSVVMTTKHFPGGGPQVEGQDPHFDWGKDQHYPGGKFEYHLKPFQAAIDAGTSAIMPYYAKPIDPALEPVAFAYNKGIIKDLLRDKMGFEGIINSDTGPIEMMPWGVEDLSILERYAKALECGVDLFSGTADPTLLLQTINDGLVSESRIDESVRRLLKEKFAMGLFENPYVDPQKATEIVGNKKFQGKADLALRKSIVLLRNEQGILPLKSKKKVCFITWRQGRGGEPMHFVKPQKEYANIEIVDSREEADVVLLWLMPTSGGLFNSSEKELELQLSKNNIEVAFVNETTYHKPTILAINYTNPWVIDEIDNPNVGTVLATFGTTPEALLDIITGEVSPTGKMPISTPKSKKAVLKNLSDVPGYLEESGDYLFKFNDGITY